MYHKLEARCGWHTWIPSPHRFLRLGSAVNFSTQAVCPFWTQTIYRLGVKSDRNNIKLFVAFIDFYLANGPREQTSYELSQYSTKFCHLPIIGIVFAAYNTVVFWIFFFKCMPLSFFYLSIFVNLNQKPESLGIGRRPLLKINPVKTESCLFILTKYYCLARLWV